MALLSEVEGPESQRGSTTGRSAPLRSGLRRDDGGSQIALNGFVPATDLVASFRRDMDALVGRPLDTDRLLVAVSGGPDSLALLLLAHAAYGAQVRAATVNHGLRIAARDEARFVAELCAARCIPHQTLTGADAPRTGSLQAQARTLRYRLLADHAAATDCRWLATGHHRDDQAETLLMRIARGSGLPGLASIRARRSEAAIEIIRPVLGWTRATLRTIVDEAGIVPVDDPSNRSPDHDRTHFRDVLARTALLDPARLAESASHLAQCEDSLGWAAASEWDMRSRDRVHGTRSLDVADLPRELRRRLVLRAIDEVRREHGLVADWRRGGAGRLLDLLDAGRTATLARVKCVGGRVWRFEAARPRRAPS